MIFGGGQMTEVSLQAKGAEAIEQQRRRRREQLARFITPPDNRLVRQSWVIASLLLVLIGVAAGEIVVALAGAAIFVSGLLARLWGRMSLERLEVYQSLSNPHAFVGETVRFEFRLVNRKLLPLPWLEVRTELPEILAPENRSLDSSGMPKIGWLQRSTSMRWYERITWSYAIPLTTRGYYRLGATRLRSGDLFGFFTRERIGENELALWVYPEIIPLPQLGIPLVRPHGEGRGGSPLFEDPTRLQGLRDYRSGDPLRRVDWKATARRLKLQSRVYDPSSTAHVILALNVTTLPEAWQGFFGDVFERAVSVTASLAAAYAAERIPLGLFANCTYPGRDATIRVPAGRADAQLTRVFEALAMADVFTLVPIERLLAEEARRLPLGSTVILVTALVTDGISDALARLRRHGYGVSLIYVGPDDPPATAGGAVVHDIRPALNDLQFRLTESGYTWTRAGAEFQPPPNGQKEPGPSDSHDADEAGLISPRPAAASGDRSPWARPPRERKTPKAGAPDEDDS